MNNHPTIKLGREYYEHFESLLAWARENLGKGIVEHSPFLQSGHDWSVSVMFGHQTWTFKNEEVAGKFSAQARDVLLSA